MSILNKKISQQIDQKNIAIVEGCDIMDVSQAHDRQAFEQCFENLVCDEYLKGDAHFRYRRYGQMVWDQDRHTLEKIPHETFFQPQEMNTYAGGIQRVFAALEEKAFENTTLRMLITGVLSCWPWGKTIVKCRIGIHMIRIVGLKNAVGHPTPEGKHRDGFDFIALCLVQRKNVFGGMNTVYTPSGQKIIQHHLVTPYSMILLNDRKVLHDASAITPIDPEQPAVRDMLVLCYDGIY